MELNKTQYYECGDKLQKQYIESLQQKLPKLSKAKERDNLLNYDFLVAVALISFSWTDCGIKAKAEIDRDPHIACNPNMRKTIEGYDFGGRVPDFITLNEFRLGKIEAIKIPIPMRMSAGGAITVINVPENDKFKDYIVIGQKDNGPVIHSEHLIPSSGLSERYDEWTNPLIIVCDESVEEIRILDRLGSEAFCPVFSSDDEDEDDKERFDLINNIVSGTFEERIEMGIEYNKEPRRTRTNCDARIEHLGMDELEIIWDGHPKRTLKGLLILDPVFGALDLMAAVRVKLPIPLSKLQILDGEGIKKTGKLFNRPTFVFEPAELAKLFNGEQSEALRFHSSEKERNGECIEGKKVKLSSKPLINPPLWDSGPALLGLLYKHKIDRFPLSEAEYLKIEEV